MRGAKQIVLSDFSKGLHSTVSPFELGAGELAVTQNMEPMAERGIKRRSPLALVRTLAAQPSLLIVSESLGINVALTATNSYNLTSGAALGAPSLTGADIGWAEGPASGGQGPIYALDTPSTPRYFTGTAWGNWTTSGTLAIPTGGKGAIAYHGNRMWIGGSAANPSRLFFSDLGDPRAFQTNNYVDIDPTAGGAISAICPCGPYLLVFKDRRVYVVYDLNTGANRLLSSTVGVQAANGIYHPQAVVQGTYGTAYFIARDGIYVTDGSTVRRISDNFDWLSQRFTSLTYISDYLFAALPVSGFLFGIYDERHKSWWQHRLARVQQTPPARALINGVETFLLADISGVMSWTPDHTNHWSTTGWDVFGDGVSRNSTAYFSSGGLGGDSPLRKRIREIAITGLYVPRLSMTKDATNVLTRDLTFTGPINRQQARVASPGTAIGFDVGLTDVNYDPNLPWWAEQITISYQERTN